MGPTDQTSAAARPHPDRAAAGHPPHDHPPHDQPLDDQPRDEQLVAALRAEIEGLRLAMASRSTIEQAKGIVMATMHCDEDEAFRILAQQSQHENRKLREVAAELVERSGGRRTRLPGPSGPTVIG